MSEDELGDSVPITHALFLPKDETLSSAPFPVVWQSGLPDAVALTAAKFIISYSANGDLKLAIKTISLSYPLWKDNRENYPTW